MIITFGTGFYGKVATFKGQWIETKFWGIMFIPIIPIKSMYVTEAEFRKRHGVEIDLHTKSVVATYLRLLTSAIALFFGFLFFSGETQNYSYVIALIFFLLALYFFFAFGKAKTADIELRTKFGSITGLYALPHWFEHSDLYLKLEAFIKSYQKLYPENDWKKDLMSDDIEPEKIKLLYAIGLLNYMVSNDPEDDELYARADTLYQIPLETAY